MCCIMTPEEKKKNSLCDGSSIIDGSVVKAIYQEYSVSRTPQKGYPSPKPVPNLPLSLSTDVSAKEGGFDPVHTD